VQNIWNKRNPITIYANRQPILYLTCFLITSHVEKCHHFVIICHHFVIICHHFVRYTFLNNILCECHFNFISYWIFCNFLCQKRHHFKYMSSFCHHFVIICHHLSSFSSYVKKTIRDYMFWCHHTICHHFVIIRDIMSSFCEYVILSLLLHVLAYLAFLMDTINMTSWTNVSSFYVTCFCSICYMYSLL